MLHYYTMKFSDGLEVFNKPLTLINTWRKNEINSVYAHSKYSAVKKIPNFAEIHKQMFARSESIIDVKNRLKDRHTALTKLNSPANVKINSREKVPLSNKSNKNFNNHTEFKMKKHETTDCILKDYASHSTRG
ncbi:PREDICTED: uncharacterized protein LOC108553488 [Eufriesea mexicana]|uniref:uncharacterized protein LOC108553488 n=1 Tax=Eufriesea mexicana TaxID=516756 RepID=UPI00083C57A4|nr:PREDICTED: uncharacterized protein LOC108553488 [Eufriesea mexicana]